MHQYDLADPVVFSFMYPWKFNKNEKFNPSFGNLYREKLGTLKNIFG